MNFEIAEFLFFDVLPTLFQLLHPFLDFFFFQGLFLLLLSSRIFQDYVVSLALDFLSEAVSSLVFFLVLLHQFVKFLFHPAMCCYILFLRYLAERNTCFQYLPLMLNVFFLLVNVLRLASMSIGPA